MEILWFCKTLSQNLVMYTNQLFCLRFLLVQNRDSAKFHIKKNNLLIHFFGCAGALLLYRLSLVVCRLLIAEHGLKSVRISVAVAYGLSSCGFQALNRGPIVVTHGLSCLLCSIFPDAGKKICGVFPDQGLNLCLLDQQADSLPLSHQGSLMPYL